MDKIWNLRIFNENLYQHEVKKRRKKKIVEEEECILLRHLSYLPLPLPPYPFFLAPATRLYNQMQMAPAAVLSTCRSLEYINKLL